jgi:hypothetical protein
MHVCGKDIVVRGRLIRVARLTAERYEFLDDPSSAIAELRAAPRRVDVFTFLPPLPHPSPLYAYPMEWDNVAALRVTTFEQWWKGQINGKTRNMIRRAENNGVKVAEVPFGDELVKGISEIYNETPVRQGRAFWHYAKDLAAVRRENGTFLDRSVFLGAFLEDRLIGFAKLVIAERASQAGLMQILSMIRHRDKSPTNALIAQAVRSCVARSIPYLVYANFAYGNKQHDSLSDFKRHNGFERVDLPRYFVPLTALGRLALRYGLHRSAQTRIPASVLSSFRRLRSVWHESRLPRAKEMF